MLIAVGILIVLWTPSLQLPMQFLDCLINFTNSLKYLMLSRLWNRIATALIVISHCFSFAKKVKVWNRIFCVIMDGNKIVVWCIRQAWDLFVFTDFPVWPRVISSVSSSLLIFHFVSNNIVGVGCDTKNSDRNSDTRAIDNYIAAITCLEWKISGFSFVLKYFTNVN